MSTIPPYKPEFTELRMTQKQAEATACYIADLEKAASGNIAFFETGVYGHRWCRFVGENEIFAEFKKVHEAEIRACEKLSKLENEMRALKIENEKLKSTRPFFRRLFNL